MLYLVKIGKYADYVFAFNIAGDAIDFAQTVKSDCINEITVEIELIDIENKKDTND